MDELTAAGIMDPELRYSFAKCKELNRQHGKTYYLATLLLPPDKRPYVHALYGFARFADDIVDNLDPNFSELEKKEKLEKWSAQRLADLKSGRSQDEIGLALLATVQKFNIPIEYFEDFLKSMAMDLTITSYETFADLEKYIYGSASVIGLQMLPILGVNGGAIELALAKKAAINLGNAFQLANFIRDVSEDLERGRIYLPLSELAKYGITPEILRQRKVTPELKNALEFQVQRVRDLRKEAEVGIKLLSKKSRPCIEAASKLYCGIAEEVVKNDYQVFKVRARTSMGNRIFTFILALVKGKLS